MKVVITGAGGFIGRSLASRWRAEGAAVTALSRSRGFRWEDGAMLTAALEGADLCLNLAGRSVNCRYHARQRHEILSSRLRSTAALGEALRRCADPPPLWINASTATIYRHAEDRPMTEEDGELGSGFSEEVAKAWEDTLFSFASPGLRQVALRMAIVLGRDGGALPPYRRLAAAGLGGPQGSGRQMISWIHIDDLFRAINFLARSPALSGPVNASSPHPVPNSEFMRTLRKTLGVPFGCPSPRWLLEAGALLAGTETELLLKSRWVLPRRLLDAGFVFRQGELGAALRDLLGRKAAAAAAAPPSHS